MNLAEQAVVVLNNFLLAMNKWENYWYNLKIANPTVDYRIEQKKEIDIIYEKYVTTKERKQGRQVSLSARYPSTFTPNYGFISYELSSNNKKIAIEIHHKFDTGIEGKYRYNLIFKDNECRIDRREIFDYYDNKSIKDNL